MTQFWGFSKCDIVRSGGNIKNLSLLSLAEAYSGGGGATPCHHDRKNGQSPEYDPDIWYGKLLKYEKWGKK